MSRQYTDEERVEALALLRCNRSNVALTSKQTRIPERTLREWRRLQRVQNGLPPDPLPAAAAADMARQFAESSEAVEYVRDQFLNLLVDLTDSLPEILSAASPYHQLLTVMQMIDRIEKLQMLVPLSTREPSIRIQFVDADGTTHDDPYWQRSLAGDDTLN